jgi:putative SOS response-associated peptidase YedK
MPAILDPADYAAWLGAQPASSAAPRAMLKPFPAERMEAFKIGRKIGNVKSDEPGLVEPV